MMRQTTYPSQTGPVARLRNIQLLCETAEGFEKFFRGFTHYQHLCNPLVWVRAWIELVTLSVGVERTTTTPHALRIHSKLKVVIFQMH